MADQPSVLCLLGLSTMFKTNNELIDSDNRYKGRQNTSAGYINGKTAMSGGMGQKLVRQFNKIQTGIDQEPKIGHLSAVNDDLVRIVDEKIRELTVHNVNALR